MWRTIRYFCVCTTRTLTSFYCCITVVDSPLSRCFVMDFAGLVFFRTHSLEFFLVRKEFFFVPRKDGILYFITLRSDGFRWSSWHVDSRSVLLARPLVVISCIAECGSPLSGCFRRYHRPYPRSNFMMPSVRHP